MYRVPIGTNIRFGIWYAVHTVHDLKLYLTLALLKPKIMNQKTKK